MFISIHKCIANFVFEEKKPNFAAQLNEGTGSPLFFSFMISQDIQKTIEDFLNQNLDSESHFLVKVSITHGKVNESKVQVFMDSDQGINISECVTYNRKLSGFLEENDPFEGQYTLEVTSPGLDFPLSSDRQFAKNLNRKLHLELNDGKEMEGKLLSVSEQFLDLEVEEKLKGKKVALQTIQVPRIDIKKAKVTVSFK